MNVHVNQSSPDTLEMYSQPEIFKFKKKLEEKKQLN